MKQFSDQHDVALAVMVISVALSVWIPHRFPDGVTRWVSIGLAVLIFAAWAGEYVADGILHIWTVEYDLPLQLTDVISVMSIAALLTRRRLLVELVFFWSFTASLQAVVTPDLAYSFPSVFYFTYFVYHIGAIVAASLLVFGCRLYPRRGAWWRVFVATLVWAAVAGAGDVITGGNYMYLHYKPVHSTLLSVLGRWPWYIAGAAGVALAMLLVLAGLMRAFGAVADDRAASGWLRW